MRGEEEVGDIRKRVKRLRLSAQVLVMMSRQSDRAARHDVVENALPRDAEFVGFVLTSIPGTVEALVWSASYPEVSDVALAAQLPDPVFKRVEQACMNEILDLNSVMEDQRFDTYQGCFDHAHRTVPCHHNVIVVCQVQPIFGRYWYFAWTLFNSMIAGEESDLHASDVRIDIDLPNIMLMNTVYKLTVDLRTPGGWREIARNSHFDVL